MIPSPAPSCAPFSLEVRDLGKRFVLHQRGGTVLQVLEHFSMTVRGTECVALVGASGRGKSTIIKCLYGNYAVDTGRILLRNAEHCTDWPRPRHRPCCLRCTTHRPRQPVPARRAADQRTRPGGATTARRPATDAGRRLPAATVDACEKAGALLARLQLPRSVWSLPLATFPVASNNG
ncbi:MAG: ATP-binding cassette domain-containing protein [Burkholderiaceae bacterium]